MAGWANFPKTKEMPAVQHYDGRASSSGDQQATVMKIEKMTHRVDPDTAKKNGWTAEMQTIKLASSLHGMRLSFARLVNDEHEMRKMAKATVTGFEIEELFEYLTNSQAGSMEDLVYAIARVRGDLDEICNRVYKHVSPEGAVAPVGKELIQLVLCSFYPSDMKIDFCGFGLN